MDLLDPVLAENVARHDPSDFFTISQFLLGIRYYEARLRAIFPRGGVLLDVGCGAGNWSLAGASLYDKIIALDRHEGRLHLAGELIRKMHVEDKVDILCADASILPIPEASIDHVLCFNVLPFLDKEYTMLFRKFRNVIRRNGHMYIAATGPGYIIYLFRLALHQRTQAQTEQFITTFQRNVRYLLRLRPNPASFVGQRTLMESSSRTGWRLVHAGAEGSLSSASLGSIFTPTYMGMPFMREYLFEAV